MPGSNGNGQAEAYGVASRIAGDAGSSGSSGSSGSPLPWLAGPAGDAISGVFNTINAWVNRRFQERMMNQQRQWQLEDWNRQNNYNAPSAVMARMASAGLNPDLLTGGNSSNATVPAQGPAPSGSQAHPMSMLGTQAAVQALLGNRLTESQISLNKAQADNIEADAERKKRENDMDIGGVNVRKILHDMSSRDAELAVSKALADSNVDLNSAQKSLLMTQTKQVFVQYLMDKKRADRYGQELDDYHNLRFSEITRNCAEADLARSRKNYTDHDVRILQDQIEVLAETQIARINDIVNEATISANDATVSSGRVEAELALAAVDYINARMRTDEQPKDWEYYLHEWSQIVNGGVLVNPSSRGRNQVKRGSKPNSVRQGIPNSVRQGMDHFGHRNTPYGRYQSTGGNW